MGTLPGIGIAAYRLRVAWRRLAGAGVLCAAAFTASCGLFAPTASDVQSAFGAFTAGVSSTTNTLTPNTTTIVNENSQETVVATFDVGDPNAVTAAYRFDSYRDVTSGYVLDGTLTWEFADFGDANQQATVSGTLRCDGGPVTRLAFFVRSRGTGYGGYVVANDIERWDVPD